MERCNTALQTLSRYFKSIQFNDVIDRCLLYPRRRPLLLVPVVCGVVIGLLPSFPACYDDGGGDAVVVIVMIL